MGAMLFRKRRSVGVDIGASQIKVVELEGSLARPRLVKFGLAKVLPGAIERARPHDLGAVSDALRLVFSKYSFSTNEVVVNIGKGEVFATRIKTESLPAAELERRIGWEASNYLPFEPESATVEFLTLGAAPSEPYQNVLLVAARTDLVEDRARMVENAGLKLRTLESDLVAIHHLLERRANAPADLLVIDLGASMTAAYVFVGGQPQTLRLFDIGTKNLVQTLQEQSGLDFAASCQMVNEGLSQPTVSDACAEMGRTLRDKIDSVIRYLPPPAPASLDVVLTGGGFLLPGWFDLLPGQLERTVAYFGPLAGIEVDLGRRRDEFVPQAELLSVALGLALRGLL